MSGRRLAICYAAPGQNLVSWAGPSRNVLSAASALSRWADVTVAFRRVPEPIDESAFRVLAIEPGPGDASAAADDNATRGIRPVHHLAYCRTVWSFARQHASHFDVVLEKGWRLSGLLALACRRAGVPAIVVENDVRCWTEPVDGIRQLAKYGLHQLAEAVAGTSSRRAARVIAETDGLKSLLVSRRGIPADRIDVVGLGVDHGLFRPMSQADARSALGMKPGATVMMYVGGMDEYHDLEPVIRALKRSRAAVDLHVVGDGEFRARYEAMAREAGISGCFHGRVSHHDVPTYIAAADLCIAPYRTGAFHGRRLTFSTLKIPEYMACARPVVGVPCDSVLRVITPGVSGFVAANDTAAWCEFLTAMPSRERLAAMREAAAAAVQSVTWDATAASYLEACHRVIANDPACQSALAGQTGLSRL